MKFKLLVASVALATAQVQAGGFENARLDTSFMYDDGSLVSLGTLSKSYDVTGSTSATSKSVITDRSAGSFQAKYQLNDSVGFGLHAYESGALHLNYQGTGGYLQP